MNMQNKNKGCRCDDFGWVLSGGAQQWEWTLVAETGWGKLNECRYASALPDAQFHGPAVGVASG
jgi:hypothetical protein